MSSLKSIINDWRKYTGSLNESQLYSQDAVEFDVSKFSDASSTQFIDKTNLSFEEFIRDIVSTVSKEKGKKLFVSFIDKYEEDKTPSLGVSPNIKYNTPHGIYGYPLNNNNVYRLLTSGSPTNADFAVDRDYMHVYTVSDINTVEIDPNRPKRSNYSNKNFNKDVETMSKTILRFLQRMIDKDDIIEEIVDDAEYPSPDLQYLIDNGSFKPAINSDYIIYHSLIAYVYRLYKIEKRNDIEIVSNLKSIVINLSETNNNRFHDYVNTDKFYSIYYIARLYSSLPMLAKSGDNFAPRQGGIFSILLSGIGIDNIDDSKGSSTIHPNEPSQALSIDISDMSSDNLGFKLVGTYKSPENYFSSNNGSSQVDDVIDEMLSKGEIDIEDVYPKGYDYNLTKRHASGDINNLSIEDAINHVAMTVDDKTSEVINKISDVSKIINDNFENDVYHKCAELYEEIFNELKSSINEIKSNYIDVLKSKGCDDDIIESIFSLSTRLNTVFKRLRYLLGFVSLDEKQIASTLESKSFLSSRQSKLNFSNFLKFIYFYTESEGFSSKVSKDQHKRFVNSIISLLRTGTELVENNKCRSILPVYRNVYRQS